MVIIEYSEEFKKNIQKIKLSDRERIIKQIKKINSNPKIGKPMRYSRKGTREVYIKPFRLAYAYSKNIIRYIQIYHKDKQ